MSGYRKPIVKGAAFKFFTALIDQTDGRKFMSSPTLAAGDVKVSSDDGSTWGNITTLPTVTTDTAVLEVDLSATEMDADNGTVLVKFQDASGAEWCDEFITVDADLAAAGVVTGEVTATVTPTTTSVTTDLSGYATDFFKDRALVFISGSLKGQSTKITASATSNGQLTFDAVTAAPSSTDKFMILGELS